MGAAEAVVATAVERAWLRRLRIRDFRNLAAVELEPSPEGLALVGDNGQGKTNFLEAVYYLQLLRSFRGARDQELVRFGAPGFHLSAALEGTRAREVAVGFERGPAARGAGGRKRVRLDGAEPPRLSDALGAVPAVIFSPQDAVLISGAPSERRRFLDVSLALSSRPYLAALQQYRGALARRNAALREVAQAGGGGSDAPVSIWEPALARAGAALWRARLDWTAAHAAHFSELCAAIGEQQPMRIRYVSAVHLEGDLEGVLREALERRRALDIKRGVTHAGPHRDDLAITLEGAEGTARELRTYGSAGQQRTAAIALRLLEAATLRAASHREPLVLLDDPFAELDARRAGRILELLNAEGRGQTLLAVPRAGDIPPGLTRLERWRVEGGVLAREPA
ncbi:MAG TPA: DNA replication and repair protein RecF [Gemmatimonadaceae bacterium]|nr:DNA replication and repair protein RecF [Gemmatimonadaceae bacterium]